MDKSRIIDRTPIISPLPFCTKNRSGYLLQFWCIKDRFLSNAALGKYGDFYTNFYKLKEMYLKAGIVKKSSSSVKECLKNYPTDDAIEMVLHAGGLRKVDLEYKRQKMENIRNRGIFERTKEVLNPPVQTRYQTLLTDLEETILDSYWNKDLGKARDVAGKIPGNINAETTFGKITAKEPIKDIINPPKSVSEICFESAQYHELYKKSHNDYNPGEQVHHNYNVPSFNPKQRFGIPRKFDPKLTQVRCLQQDTINSEPITSTNSVQADYIARTRFQLGKSLEPNNNYLCLPPKHRFGKKSIRPLYGAEELMKPDYQVSLIRKDFLDSLKFVNVMRYYFKKQEIDINELIELCLENDKEKNGWINDQALKQIFFQNGLTLNYKPILHFAKSLGFYENTAIKYENFINLFDINKKLPELPAKFDNFNYDPYYVTTYQSAQLDALKIDETKIPSAGVPSTRTDLKFPSSGSQGCKVDEINLGQETNAEYLINPSIYSNYGLTQYDFWKPRTPEYIQKLFKSIGFEFPNDTFNQLWEYGLQIDKTGMVCIDTFKNLLYQTAPLEMKTQPPITCDF